ncbi:hypothetical protein MASR1M90_19170 [Desulfovibrionales bacterium]
MEEDILLASGFIPVEDERIGQGYETCPLHHKALIKNAVSFAYALAPKDMAPVEHLRQMSHVREHTQAISCNWALFVFDEQRFPVPAMLSAVVPALVARVQTLIVASVRPCSPALFLGLDLLGVDQVYETPQPHDLAACLHAHEPGVILNFSAQPMPTHCSVQSFAPEHSACTLHAALSPDQLAAYHDLFACVHTEPDQPVYLAYADQPLASAPRYTLSVPLLGCWVWETIHPDIFRFFRTSFSYAPVPGYDA